MDMDHGHGNASTKATCPMIMVFHGGHCERILWRSWVASTYVEFTFSCLAFVLLGYLYEALKFLRQLVLRHAARKEAARLSLAIQAKNGTGSVGPASGCSNTALADIRQKTYWEQITSSAHIITSLLFIIQIALSYLLMLVFMNYNYWLCLSTVLGLGLGYYCFGWSRRDAYDNECCH